MPRLRFASFFALTSLASAVAGATLVPSDAEASVSIAISFESLVKDADTVAIATPLENKSVWEDGRIITYTKLRVEQGVAGENVSETWIRTLGGVVGQIGQLVDGEPVFTPGKSSLLFLHKFKTGGTYEVSARAQGQYPIVFDDQKKLRKVIRSANVGALLPPKGEAAIQAQAAAAQNLGITQGTQPLTVDQARAQAIPIRFAQEVMHDKPLDEISREVASTWKRMHPATK